MDIHRCGCTRRGRHRNDSPGNLCSGTYRTIRLVHRVQAVVGRVPVTPFSRQHSPLVLQWFLPTRSTFRPGFRSYVGL